MRSRSASSAGCRQTFPQRRKFPQRRTRKINKEPWSNLQILPSNNSQRKPGIRVMLVCDCTSELVTCTVVVVGHPSPGRSTITPGYHAQSAVEAVRMSANRSTFKHPWGTIVKPEFGMGHQKMTADEVEQAVNRLYYIPTPRKTTTKRNNPDITVDQADEMLERLTKYDRNLVPDSDRRIQSSPYKDLGIVHSFAWKGYT
ncbi:uncharacterized protein LOC135474052 [Liolophura sinensis]|uniref:uncharacterized protein LOC135474052 n=1 Tax=Liolophura sinensis TaxID=3198878 RepID=UPI003158D996